MILATWGLSGSAASPPKIQASTPANMTTATAPLTPHPKITARALSAGSSEAEASAMLVQNRNQNSPHTNPKRKTKGAKPAAAATKGTAATTQPTNKNSTISLPTFGRCSSQRSHNVLDRSSSPTWPTEIAADFRQCLRS